MAGTNPAKTKLAGELLPVAAARFFPGQPCALRERVPSAARRVRAPPVPSVGFAALAIALRRIGRHSDPRVNDGVAVRIGAPPSLKIVEPPGRALSRREKCPGDTVSLEQCGQGAVVPILCIEVAGEERIAVQLDPAVDEGRDPAENQVTAKSLTVEDRSVEPQALG